MRFLEKVLETVANGLIDTPQGNVLLRVGDNVNTNANAYITAAKNVSIYGDFARAGELSSGVATSDAQDPGFGTVMHLAGHITPGDWLTKGYLTRIFGFTDTDTFNLDQTYLGGETKVYGSNTPSPCAGGVCTAPVGDSEDFFFVNQLQTMNVGAGHQLTLDGQSGTDTYVINTTGSQPCFAGDTTGASCHNYVVNALDTGNQTDGSDVLMVNGYDNTTCSGYVSANVGCPTDDVFLLRRENYIAQTPTSTVAGEVSHDPAFVALLHGQLGLAQTFYAGSLGICFDGVGGCLDGQTLTAAVGTFAQSLKGLRIHLGGTGAGVWAGDYTVATVAADGSSITVAESLPAGVSLTTEQVPTSTVALTKVTVGVLSNDVTTSDPTGSSAVRTQNYERINYDTGINGRLIVNGLGGNDYFASDDVTTITTLAGGAGNDSFQIGQIYGRTRDPFGDNTNLGVSADGLTRDTSGGDLNKADVFGTIATTRGWISAGNSAPLLVDGDTGDDTFTVYSNQAATRLEGGADNDLFVVRAFALAQTKTNNGDPTAADCTPSPSDATCDIVWINAQDQIAMPKLTSGFSTAAESDIRTGSGTNQVEYNLNAPVSIDGGSGFNKVVILGTEFADHIVVTAKAIYGAGLNVTYVNIQVLEIDALEGDDTIDVLSTAPGVVTRVIGGLGSDTVNVAGDVAGDVQSISLDGTSSTLNHGVVSTDPTYNGLLADGVQIAVARPAQGGVVITESAGFSAIYEGGCFALNPGASCASDPARPPLPSLDSYTVNLASAPDCGFGPNDPNCHVYITVSVAYPPASEHGQLTLGSIPDGPPTGNDGETFLVSRTMGSPTDFTRTITLNGSTKTVQGRSIVLDFTGANWNSLQSVFLFAYDDVRPEGTRILTASHTVLQPVCGGTAFCYDDAKVRNVEVTVYDNDQPDVQVVQLDPNTLNADNNTVALEGTAVTAQKDTFTIQLANAPAAGTVVVVKVLPGDARVCLTSTDLRFSSHLLDPTTCAAAGTTYYATFDSTNWYQPLYVDLYGRNDSAPEDPHNTAVLLTIDPSTTDASYNAAAVNILGRVDAQVIDDENPGVFVMESDGSTLVQCGTACGGPGTGDSYTLRLTHKPTSDVKIFIVTDGQVDATVGGRVAIDSFGGTKASQAFKGQLVYTSSTVLKRGLDADLGSFLDEGFQVGMRITLSNTGNGNDGEYRVADVTASTITLTTSLPFTAASPNDVIISQLQEKGTYTGSVNHTLSFQTIPGVGKTIVRDDGLSWLDAGFLEGMLFKVSGDLTLYKVQAFVNVKGGTLNGLVLTADPAFTLSSINPMATLTQWAAYVTFNATNWYQPVTVPLLADPYWVVAPGLQNLRTFPKQQHRLDQIRGPLSVEGGTTTADRSLHAAVLLPGEGNGPVFRVAAQAPEWQQIDTMNVYDDGSHEDLTGSLTSTSISGLNMGPSLDFTNLLGGKPAPFGETAKYPGGISYGSISLDSNGNFVTDGNLSTLEIVNLLLGAGNDHFSIQSTLVQGGDFNPITGQRDTHLANHGGITAVHGGGNALLDVTGTFAVAAGGLVRTDGLAWAAYGFQVGQQVSFLGNSYTVTGFGNSGVIGTLPGDKLLLDRTPGTLGATSGTVAVSDYLQVTSTFVLSGNGVLLTNGQAWQALGYRVGQTVYLPGYGYRMITSFGNGTLNGIAYDGGVLNVDGAALPTTTLTGTISVSSRYRISGSIVLTPAGSGDGGTITVTPSAGTVAGSGLAVGMQLLISGLDSFWTITGISGNVITVTGGTLNPASFTGTVSAVRVGGDAITLTGASATGAFGSTSSTLTRAVGSWITDGFAVNANVLLTGLSCTNGCAFKVLAVTATTLTLSGLNGAVLSAAAPANGTVTVLPTGAGPTSPLVVYGDTSQDGVWYGGDPLHLSLHNFGPKPMPHVEGVAVTLTNSVDGKTATVHRNDGKSFITDGFAVGQELTLGPISGAAPFTRTADVGTDRLTLHAGNWLTSGLQPGQQITLCDAVTGCLTSQWTVTGFGNSTYGVNTVLLLNGPTLTPLPNRTLTISAVSTYVGIVKAITADTLTLNLAIALADFPTGPHFPEAAGSSQTIASENVRAINRVGNSAPFFVFPLANPFRFSGNDVIDAHLLDWADPTNALRTIGLTVYGGSGDDTIIGSQTGDQLAGGSGNDTILGQRGQDLIYGDSGFNVDLITRLLSVATIGAGPTGYPAAQYPDHDLLVAGNDLLYGEGPGSASYADGTIIGNDDDVIFGDLGVVTQDVSGARDTTKPLPLKYQALQTTLLEGGADNGTGIVAVDSRALQNAGNDWIYGNEGRDLLVGGAGDDAIDGGAQNDMILGDNVSMARRLGIWTSPRFQTLCGSLMYSRSDLTNPCAGNAAVTEYASGQLLTNGIAQTYRTANDVPWWAEYAVTNLWHDFAADNGLKWVASFGNDYIAGGPANDVILGELGNDTVQGDGSIDWIAPGAPTTLNGTLTLQRVAAYRTTPGCTGAVGSTICDPTGTLVLYPSVERASDGEDYIEGNGGNDVLLGNLGQDDLVGGSSDFYSLTNPYLRPDGGDYALDGSSTTGDLGMNLLFGGAGTQAGMSNQTTSLADGTGTGTGALANQLHARDADTLIGNNGDIIRIVGVVGVDTSGCALNNVTCLSSPTVARYVTYAWDTYDGSTCTGTGTSLVCTYDPNGKQVVRGVNLLDYTPGGPDFAPCSFGFPCNSKGVPTVAAGTCNTSPTQPVCSTVLPTAHGLTFSSAACAASPTTCVLPDIGGVAELHGESGDDTLYGGAGSQRLYGDGGNDQIIGGWGSDWISGGTGDDTILGDDGRIFVSRNSATGLVWSTTADAWLPTACAANSAGCYSEPLFGIRTLLPTDPDTRNSGGNVLNEFIYTPGMVQTSTINVAGALNASVDLTPYNLTPRSYGAAVTAFDANNSDDIIFGGWGNDQIHGGSGDDAISGDEALATSYAPLYDNNGNPTGLVLIDWNHPYNPSDVLHFGADTNAWHSNHHVAQRLGEFLLYDEYDPRRILLFNADGTVWKGGSGSQPTTRQYFLNNDPTDGNPVLSCVAVDNQGNCTATANTQSDGNDVLFGDLGNDWLVGGTGQDTMWGGWGNDLLQADDNQTTGTSFGFNDVPDGVNSSYQDRAFGGAGLDILIANTGGDRLIDWVGEFNTYLVPFAPFGIATVSRQNAPALPEFLYALSHAQGADATRASDTGGDPVRNGEPNGELGLVRQSDHGLWQQQTGGPTDPQAGNIPGGRRDTLRGADFNDGSTQAFATDSGSFTVVNGQLQVAASSQGQDAVAVWYADAYLPVYYEVHAMLSMNKPTGGWMANSYVVFDYWSPTDFKFAGVDDSTNKLEVGHRDASGWHIDNWSSIPGGVKPNTWYDTTVAVNGLVATVTIGSASFSYTFAPRVLADGTQVGLNQGFIGFGSNNSQGYLDNTSLQVIPPTVTLDRTSYFEDGTPGDLTRYLSGAWNVGAGRYVGSSTVVDPVALSTAVIVPTGLNPTDYLELEATLRTGTLGGIAFDSYAANDYKFVALDIPGQRVIVGHVDPRRGWVVQTSYAKALTAGTDYVLNLVLKGTVVTVTLNGSVLGSFTFAGDVVDGQFGTLSNGGTTSFDRFRFRTDDAAFPVTAIAPEVRIGDATVTEGNSGTTTVTVTLMRTGDLTNASSVTWRTYDRTATAASDYTSASGTATFAAGSSTATITVQVSGDVTYEANETFGIQVLSAPGYNVADGFGQVTITNDDAQPAGSTAPATSPTSTSAPTSSATFTTPPDTATSTTTTTTTTSSTKGSFVATVTPDRGVWFSVTGGGHRTSLSVRISCDTGYSTVINVPLDANGAGRTSTVYPPGGSSCTATLEDPQAIDRSRVLGSTAFTV